MVKALRTRLAAAGIAATLLVAAVACQGNSSATGPVTAVAAASDASADQQISELTFGSTANKKTFRIIGSELLHPDGRRVKIEPEMARRFHAVAAAAIKMRKQEAALAPAWKKAGLPSIEEALAARRARQASVSDDLGISRAAAMESMRPASAAMVRTCEDIALDIYDSTVDFHQHEEYLETYTDAMFNCLAHAGDCTVAANMVIFWTGMIEWDLLMLNDLAYTYGNQGCWGPPN